MAAPRPGGEKKKGDIEFKPQEAPKSVIAPPKDAPMPPKKPAGLKEEEVNLKEDWKEHSGTPDRTSDYKVPLDDKDHAEYGLTKKHANLHLHVWHETSKGKKHTIAYVPKTGSEVMKKEYPDAKQRVAICLGQSQTKKSKNSLLNNVLAVLGFTYDFDCEDCGNSEELTISNLVIPKEEDYVDAGEVTEDYDQNSVEFSESESVYTQEGAI
jgi:hypothetical protein